MSVDLPAPLSPTSAITSPLPHLEIDVGESLHGAEALRDAAQLERRHLRRGGRIHEGTSLMRSGVGTLFSAPTPSGSYLQNFA